MSETWKLIALTPPAAPSPKNKILHGKSSVQVESEQSTLHTKHNLKTNPPPTVPTHPQDKKREGPSLHDTTNFSLVA